ncbi:YfcC family protein [Oceanobacillus salinisoli]|uniref:YfcC family protein n=1 Tax=Oceanobacillus salinisoli TaxID=2678611 RepID=UPI0012E12F13|nr:AbgT family transporter [Oceanobacillus salinisoli]
MKNQKDENNRESTQSKKSKWEMPDTYVILFFVLLAGFVATFIVPSGTFERETVDGVERVIPDTYQQTEGETLGILDIFNAIQTGMIESADIIFLVLFAGGMFEIIERSGALRGVINRAVRLTRNNEFWLIAVVSTIFALVGAIGAVANAVMAFVVVGVVIARALKLDPIVAAAITFGANFVGFSVGFINPYTVGIAQGIADLPLFSGMVLRIIVFVVILSVTIWYIWRYAKKILADPSQSLMGVYEDSNEENELDAPFTTRHKLLLTFVVLCLGFFVYGSIQLGWTINHMSAFFIFISLGAGIIAGMHYNTLAGHFLTGTSNLVYGALVVGVARSVIVILEDGAIIDTIVYALSVPLENLAPVLSAIGMFVSNGILNFLVNSGSGQAMIAMPLLTPLADMVGVTRQVAVQAYQFGDGLTNLIFPTSGILMASLAVAKVPYMKWLKWVFPLFLIWLGIAIVTLVIGVMINWGPF